MYLTSEHINIKTNTSRSEGVKGMIDITISTFINGQILQKEINKKTLTYHTLHPMYLTDIHVEHFHPRAAEYTFFSSTHGSTFSRVDQILDPNQGKQILKDQNYMKYLFQPQWLNMWKLNNTFLETNGSKMKSREN